MLSLRNVSYTRHYNQELTDISLKVERGEVVAVIGPNNSGKTRLLELIAGYYSQFQGEISVNHYSIRNEREKASQGLGFCPAKPIKMVYLTGLEYLELVASLYHLSPQKRLEAILGLATRLEAKETIYQLLERVSVSAHTKINLIAALVHQPNLILLDEPTLNLDPDCQITVEEIIAERARHGAAIVLATNNLPLVEKLADRIVVLRDGVIVAEATLTRLKNQTKTTNLAAAYHRLVHE